MSLRTPLSLIAPFLAFLLLSACGGGGGGGGDAAVAPPHPAIQTVAGTWYLTQSDGTVVSLALTAEGAISATSSSPFIDGDSARVSFLRQEGSFVFLGTGLASLDFPVVGLSQDANTPVGILMTTSMGTVGMLERGGPFASNPTYDATDLTGKAVQGFSLQMFETVSAQGLPTTDVRAANAGMAVLPAGSLQGGVQDFQGNPIMRWATPANGQPIMVTDSRAGIWLGALEQGPNPLPQGVSPTAAIIRLVMSTDKSWVAYIIRPDPSIESQYGAWYFCLGQLASL